jgi:hypothetical protein
MAGVMPNTVDRHLAETNDQIGEENDHIKDEKQIIEKMKKERHDTTIVERSLRAIYHFQDALGHDSRNFIRAAATLSLAMVLQFFAARSRALKSQAR